MHKDDLVTERPDGEYEDVPLDSIRWRKYQLEVLVPIDTLDRRDASPALESIRAKIDAILGKLERHDGLHLEEWLLWDVLRSWDVNVTGMGPTYEAGVCERGHVVHADDVNDCDVCQGEAERWWEDHYNR